MRISTLGRKVTTAVRIARSDGLDGLRATVREKMDEWSWARYARLAPTAMPALARTGVPRTFVYFLGGIGDDLLLTVVCRELRKREGGPTWVMSRYPELYRNNRDVDVVVPPRPYFGALMQHLNVRVLTPWYTSYHPVFDRDDPIPEHHITSVMCQRAGVTGSVSLKPTLVLDASELAGGALARRQVAIQSAGLDARHAMANKNWFPERFQAVVSSLSSRYDFVQLGAPTDPPLAGALDLRGRTSLRESAAILARSLAFVGQVGLLMHLARAVDCRSVVVYGGREAPSQSGYACNENLSGAAPCSPCWRLNSCPYDRRCMEMIAASDVVAALERQVERAGTPLAEEVVEITPANVERTTRRYADSIAAVRHAWAVLRDRDEHFAQA